VSTDPDTYTDFGPVAPGFATVEYDNIPALEKLCRKYKEKIIGLVVEPIQGEAGIKIPARDYLKKAKACLDKVGALLCADEVQTGLGRTGRMLCHMREKDDPDYVRADLVVLGKALSGGVYPVSAVLCDKHIMDVIKPGQHGSTYGGNPLGCKVAMAALDVLRDEKLSENAVKLGEVFRSTLS